MNRAEGEAQKYVSRSFRIFSVGLVLAAGSACGEQSTPQSRATPPIVRERTQGTAQLPEPTGTPDADRIRQLLEEFLNTMNTTPPASTATPAPTRTPFVENRPPTQATPPSGAPTILTGEVKNEITVGPRDRDIEEGPIWIPIPIPAVPDTPQH